jgi:hypothetical protein
MHLHHVHHQHQIRHRLVHQPPRPEPD